MKNRAARMVLLCSVVTLVTVSPAASGAKAKPSVAEKAPPIPETVGSLPPINLQMAAPQHRGVGKMPAIGSPGVASPGAQNIVRIGPGGNEIVYVSLGLPNRIATPFSHPHVISSSNDKFLRFGSDVYFTLYKDAPLGIFIAEQGNSGAKGVVASLTLIPRAGLPGQNILLKFEGMGGGNALAPSVAAADLPPPTDYTDEIRQIAIQFVQTGGARGFQEGTLDVGAARAGNILVVPEKLYIGSIFNVYRYRVENVGPVPVELTETSFGEKGVRAVFFWRNSRLAPHESTKVFIVSDRRGS